MRKFVKSLFILAVCCVLTLSLASCGGGIKGDEAKAYIRDFFDAVVAEDYEKAETFLHPDRPADLEAFFQNLEKKEDLDFGAGIEIEKYTGFSSSVYFSEVGGARYELTMRTKVGEKTVRITVEIVRNEGGYGIYNLDVDP